MPEPTRSLRSLSDVALRPSKNTGDFESTLKIGYNVLHEKFGKGKVIRLEGAGAEKKAVIFFPQEGSKTLLLKFAKLEVLD